MKRCNMNTNSIVTGKYELLPTSHLTVVRRLAKELNAHGWRRGRAFYFSGGKYTQARVKAGQLQIRMAGQPWQVAGFDSYFDDGNGNRIMASRTPRL